MKAVSPVIPGLEADEIKIAEDQPEYQTLPVIEQESTPALEEAQTRATKDMTLRAFKLPLGGIVMLSRWELTDDEVMEVIRSRSIYFYHWTGGEDVQPVLLSTKVFTETDKE